MSCSDPQMLWDAVSLLLKQHLMSLMWTKWTCGLPSLSSVRFLVVVFSQIVVSEMDHGLLRSIRFWFLRWTSCSLLTLFGIRQRCVSEVDLLLVSLSEPSLADQIST